ncbi:MMPL family transporter [Pseudomonas sp. S37]|nr:MMPL family transporter [Pseudomonas sp. S37]
MVTRQENIVSFVVKRNLILRMARNAYQADSKSTKIYIFIWLNQSSHFERRNRHMINITQINWLRDVIQAILSLKFSGKRSIYQVNTLKVVKPAKVIKMQMRRQHRKRLVSDLFCHFRDVFLLISTCIKHQRLLVSHQ